VHKIWVSSSERARAQNTTYIELLSGERTRPDAGSVSLDDTNDIANLFRRDTETSADSTDSSGRRGDEGIRAEIEIEHEGVSTLNEHALILLQSFVKESRPIDDVGLETGCELLVTLDLALGIVPEGWAEPGQPAFAKAVHISRLLEVAIALETTFDKLAELGSERLLVEEVVNAKAGTTGLGGVRRSDSLAGGSDVGPTELDLFETVDDLVEIEDHVRSIRDEEPALAVETFVTDMSASLITISVDTASRILTLLDQSVELLEKGRNVHDDTVSDEGDAFGIDETCEAMEMPDQ
jgi:hypothetical protein